MRVLLLSRPPNNVIVQLLTDNRLCVDLIDCNQYDEIESNIQKYLQYCNPDILLTYRCPYILPKEIFDSPVYGSYNIHPSLLPAYKGANPWSGVIKNRECHTGVTIHKITSNIDGGEIILQQSFEIDWFKPIDILRSQSDAIAANLVKKLIDHFENNSNEKKCQFF